MKGSHCWALKSPARPPARPPAGLIFTAGAIWNVLQKLNIPIHVQEVS